LINDWILKPTFQNWLTGKLSDVTGLAAATVFGCAVLWKKRWLVAGLITIGFAYWKSPYSQSVIDVLSAVSPFHIGRTVDFSDLLALPVVWLICTFAPVMRGLPVHRWLQQALAILSLVALTATSFVNTHMVRESADLALPREANLQATEQDLQVFVDSLAARHNLSCSPCEPLSSGRLYGGGYLSDLSLMVRLDDKSGRFLYDIRSYGLNRDPPRPKDVDSLKEELKTELRTRFPRLRIETASLPGRDSIRLAVYKKKSLTSYRDPENQYDYERAAALVKEIAIKYGMKGDQSSRLYHFGALLGPSPYDRELTISVGIADSPLVVISVYRSSDQYAELQKTIANDIAERLRTEFGSDRAGFR
jgi:hypothetical protein